jgi:hypothetical protein
VDLPEKASNFKNCTGGLYYLKAFSVLIVSRVSHQFIYTCKKVLHNAI